jgi:hypothetical protein
MTRPPLPAALVCCVEELDACATTVGLAYLYFGGITEIELLVSLSIIGVERCRCR